MGVRLFGAFAGACGVVLVLTIISASLIRWWDDRERSSDPARNAQPVSLLSGYSSVDLADLLGEPRYKLPELPSGPPPPPLATRQISGVVIVEVVVDETGRALDAKVVEATPSGFYENEAKRDALGAIYPAGAPGTRDAIIRFSVDADSTATTQDE